MQGICQGKVFPADVNVPVNKMKNFVWHCTWLNLHTLCYEDSFNVIYRWHNIGRKSKANVGEIFSKNGFNQNAHFISPQTYCELRIKPNQQPFSKPPQVRQQGIRWKYRDWVLQLCSPHSRHPISNFLLRRCTTLSGLPPRVFWTAAVSENGECSKTLVILEITPHE